MADQDDVLARLIERLCSSREEVSEALGVSPSTLYSWSVGRREPRPDNRRQLVELARRRSRELVDLADDLLDGAHDARPWEGRDSGSVDEIRRRHREIRRRLRESRASAARMNEQARRSRKAAVTEQPR